MSTKILKIEGSYKLQGSSLTNGSALLFVKSRKPEPDKPKKSTLYLYMQGHGYVSGMYAVSTSAEYGRQSFRIEYACTIFSMNFDFVSSTAEIVRA
jgi:hypothetical protein